ncbi:hypothetical protein H4219_005157 [Mycoemilia scoparia]|uniref:Uncharacterized protein n=1 Tax=Mycoemilia scoparia TaxID=417184 RepID=A0A9W7ZYP8_9FUNG|nr:hypothetical protein H4219_005157 [Mycoemilia scoparia]
MGIPQYEKPDGMSYQDFYIMFANFGYSMMPSKGVKAQYASAGPSAKAVYIMNMISFVLSIIVLITVIIQCRNRNFLERPSFRLSGSIALADMIHSAMMILMHQTNLVAKMTEIQLRVVWYFVLGSLFTSLFITDCIALHLHLTVILKKERLAAKLNPCNRYTNIDYNNDGENDNDNEVYMNGPSKSTIGFDNNVAFTNYSSSQKSPTTPTTPIVNTPKAEKSVNYKFSRISYKNPHPVSSFGNVTDGRLSTQVTCNLPEYIKKKRRTAMFAIFRMMLYPIVPLVTITVNPIFVSIKYPTYNFCFAVLALAALQGIIESIVFFINPMLDPMWAKVSNFVKQKLFCSSLPSEKQSSGGGRDGRFWSLN